MNQKPAGKGIEQLKRKFYMNFTFTIKFKKYVNFNMQKGNPFSNINLKITG